MESTEQKTSKKRTSGKKLIETKVNIFIKSLDQTLTAVRNHRKKITDDEFGKLIDFMDSQFAYYKTRLETYKKKPVDKNSYPEFQF